jgi:hypothetical protein
MVSGPRARSPHGASDQSQQRAPGPREGGHRALTRPSSRCDRDWRRNGVHTGSGGGLRVGPSGQEPGRGRWGGGPGPGAPQAVRPAGMGSLLLHRGLHPEQRGGHNVFRRLTAKGFSRSCPCVQNPVVRAPQRRPGCPQGRASGEAQRVRGRPPVPGAKPTWAAHSETPPASQTSRTEGTMGP